MRERGIVAWFASNPVAANLLMLLLLVGGAFAFVVVRIELFPEFTLDAISVSVANPGAAPEEVEEGICVKIEEEVHSIEGVKRLTSTAIEGFGTVFVELEGDADPRKALDDVKSRVDAINTFPEAAEKPTITELTMRTQVIDVAVSGDAAEADIKRTAEFVRDELNSLEGISQVELVSVRPYEISIELSEFDLREHGLTFDDVARAVRRSSIDLSGGSIKTEGGEITLRTKGQAYVGADFEELPLMIAGDGTRILLGDVARVVDGFEDIDQGAQFNGQPTALVQVFRTGDESALDIATSVREWIDTARPQLPEGIEVRPWQDRSLILRSRLDLLLRNGAQGLLLLFCVLALFLRFRLAFWISLGIPISFMGTLMVMPGLDASVNMLSLFGFILVLGIVVDDAIVVGESIYKEQQGGMRGLLGSIDGTRRVSMPVIFAVLTSVATFVPLLVLPGVFGKFFAVIPMVVIPALLFSLVESQWILPSHLSHESRLLTRLGRVPPFSWWVALQGLFARGLELFAAHVYRPALDLALRWRYLTLAAGIAVLALTAGFVGGGFLKFTFFPDIGADVVTASLIMPEGTPASVTAEAIARIEGAALELQRDLDAELTGDQPNPIQNLMASVGSRPYAMAQNRSGPSSMGGFAGSQMGEVTIELMPAEERSVASSQVVQRWRELTGVIPGAVELRFSSKLMSAGSPIDIQLAGRDIDQLTAASEAIKAELFYIVGVFDITDSHRGGKDELRLDILPAAETLGLTRSDIGRQVRQGFYGEEAQRIQRGRDDVRVMVRYPEEDRRDLFTLEQMRVHLADGERVPFSDVAAVSLTRGYSSITRTDRRRSLHVTADVDTTVANADEILESISNGMLPEVLADYSGVSYSFEGTNREQRDLVQAMGKYFLLALLAVYALMAIPFRSYVQPAIVMTAIPFGLVGAVIGHLIMGMDLSVLSLCGIVALTGVVVNDSLVLVHFVNVRRAEGMSTLKAARISGQDRFRPILLTSLTTFAGLTPLILERSVQAQFLVPMALSLGFGVLFATFISLGLVPALYLILEDVRAAARWVLGRTPADRQASEARGTAAG